MTDREIRRDTTANWMISEADSIVISGHRDPDQDSLGSQIALYHVLRDTFPDKNIASVLDSSIVETIVQGRMSSTFNYINQPGVTYATEILKNMTDGNEFDLFIGLDCSTYDRLPDKVPEIAERCRNQLFFDHHPSIDSYRRLNVVNRPHKPSTTAVLYDFFTRSRENSFEVSNDAYNALYFGLVGDTGNFSNNGTTSMTLSLASIIAEGMSVEPSRISGFYRQKSFEELVSRADVVNNMRHELDDRLVYYIHDDPSDSIAKGFSSTNNPVDVLTMIQNYQIAMTAVALGDDKFRISLRSSGRYLVNDIAERYHGGGHDLAAGCICSGDELVSLISDLRDRIKRNEGVIQKDDTKEAGQRDSMMNLIRGYYEK